MDVCFVLGGELHGLSFGGRNKTNFGAKFMRKCFIKREKRRLFSYLFVFCGLFRGLVLFYVWKCPEMLSKPPFARKTTPTTVSLKTVPNLPSAQTPLYFILSLALKQASTCSDYH
jgi:hypothetical protein